MHHTHHWGWREINVWFRTWREHHFTLMQGLLIAQRQISCWSESSGSQLLPMSAREEEDCLGHESEKSEEKKERKKNTVCAYRRRVEGF